MTREEYMKRLEMALQGVAQAEKEEALQYYNDYFDDAGVENEQSVMYSLGTPEKLAETIRKEHMKQTGTYSGDTYMGSTSNDSDKGKKNKLSGGVIALIVILAIFASPLILGLGAALGGVLIGILAAAFSIILALIVVVFALIGVSFACIVAAISLGLVSPFAAIILGGAGIFIAGVCIFLVMAVVWLFGSVLPWIFRGIGKLFKKIFGKKGAK